MVPLPVAGEVPVRRGPPERVRRPSEVLRAWDPDIRRHATRGGADGGEGGAAAEHEQHAGDEHHQLHVRDHGNRHTKAAGDHGHQQMELLVDHSCLGFLLQGFVLFYLVVW